MNTITIWKLSIFCRLYGRVVPYYPNNNEDEKFNSFHTYTRNVDIDDLQVSFEPNLKPMSYIDLVANSATNLFVMGHGCTRWDFSHRRFYETYTLYDKNGIVAFLQNALTKKRCDEVLHELTLIGQIIIDLDKG